MAKVTDAQRAILAHLAEMSAPVPADTFKGRGFVVNGLIKRGLAEWLRENPRTLKATRLAITPAGRRALETGGGE